MQLLHGNVLSWDQLLYCMTERTIVMSDSHSGICANVTADSCIINSARCFVADKLGSDRDSVDAIKFEHMYSVELKASHRAGILAHPAAPRCVLSNLLDFCHLRHRRACGLDGGNEIPAEDIELILPTSSVRLEGGCDGHKPVCRMRFADGHTAGHTCVDNSAMGNHAGTRGKNMKVFYICIALRRQLREKVLWLENVLTCGTAMIEKHLGYLYYAVRVETSPLPLGWQIERKRQNRHMCPPGVHYDNHVTKARQ